jgi:hypothetical protein
VEGPVEGPFRGNSHACPLSNLPSKESGASACLAFADVVDIVFVCMCVLIILYYVITIITI